MPQLHAGGPAEHLALHGPGWRAARVPRAAAASRQQRTGLGVTNEPDFIVNPEIRAGRLVRVLEGFVAPTTNVAAVYPSRRLLSTKVRTFVDFLAQRFAAASW